MYHLLVIKTCQRDTVHLQINIALVVHHCHYTYTEHQRCARVIFLFFRVITALDAWTFCVVSLSEELPLYCVKKDAYKAMLFIVHY